MSFPIPTEKQSTIEQGGWVRHYNRAHVMPSGGELTVPYANNSNQHDTAPGLPIQKRMHRNHSQVFGEHKEAFANHVGQTRRSTMGMDNSRINHLHYSDQGGFARKQRDLERLQKSTNKASHQDPKRRALVQAATSLSSSDLNTKSMFQHFDRNQDGTINFSSFSNGLRLAGVTTPATLQREMFNKAATNGRLDYNKFVDDMKITAKDRDQKTSLDIEDPANEYAARKEETSRNKLYGLGFALNQKSSNVNMSNGNNGSGSNHTSRRIAWNDMSKKEKHSNLVRDRVMRRLQEENDKVEAAFVSVDKQRDGCLNKTEFQQGLKRVGITLSTEDATSFFNGLPRGADGLLNYHTFANYLQEKNVNSYSLGQVRATNYSKENGRSHIVQQRVADAVALKRKDLEIVFREKDQGRGGRDSLGRKDGQVSIHDVDDVLKSCGVILSVPDTERLFDRVDMNSTGLISYDDFLKCTCGELAVDLGESSEDKKRRVRHLRSWNAISGDRMLNGELEEDLILKKEWQESRRGSFVSVKNPANVLQKKERDQLITQQRIVDLYAKNVHALKEVFSVHQNEPIDINQFLRGTKLAGMRIAPSDAERLFRSLGSKDPATGRTYVDGNDFVASLEAFESQHKNTGGTNPMDAYRTSLSAQSASSKGSDGEFKAQGMFGTPPPLPNRRNAESVQQHTHYAINETSNKRTDQWSRGDGIVRQERLASEKLLRKITNAADPNHGTRPSLTLSKAFEKVKSVKDGFVDIDGFQEGMSNLGVQLSHTDCRQLFGHFDAAEQDVISLHSFTALITDRQRSELIDSAQGIRFGSDVLDDSRILLDAWGVPSHVKMAHDDGNSRSDASSLMNNSIQHGRISKASIAKDVKKRLRVVCPKDPESARQYLLYVFRKHDNSGRKGTISHNAFRRALANFDNTFDGKRASAVIEAADTQGSGRINYFEFVDQILNVDKAKHEQISKTTGIEKSVKYNEANSEKKKSRLDWTKHRWQKFQNQWVGKHGRAAVKEMRTDANVKPSGQSWTSAPGNKQPFRVLHSSIRAPPSPMTSAPPSSPRNR